MKRAIKGMVFFGLVFFVLLLTACNQSETSSAEEPAEGSSPASENGTSSEPLKIGINIWPGFMPFHVAEQEKLFEEYGVNVEIQTFPVYSDAIQAFASGEIDVVNAVYSDLIPSLRFEGYSVSNCHDKCTRNNERTRSG